MLDPSDFANIYRYEIKHIVIANGIKEIPEQTFAFKESLISAETVALIGDYSFNDRNSLKNITNLGSNTSIGEYTDINKIGGR